MLSGGFLPRFHLVKTSQVTDGQLQVRYTVVQAKLNVHGGVWVRKRPQLQDGKQQFNRNTDQEGANLKRVS